jgi:hypothetical protein
MTNFEDRKRAQEEKFGRDQELLFKAKSRRNRMLGVWAAEKLGLSGDAAESYAKEVVAADFEKPGDDDIVGKVVRDFAAKSVPVGEAQVRDELQRLFMLAKKQLLGE